MPDIINERSSAYISVAFLDKTGAPAIPASVTYSTACRTTGIAIKTNVAVTPLSTIQINLDALDSTIQNTANKTEEKALTVNAIFNTNDESHDEYLWYVRNLAGV